MTDTQFISGPNGRIAYEWVDGSNDLPPIVFIHGFKSDMTGSKAEFLKQYCLETGRDFLRFDVFAHGQSDGNFMDFTIGKALEDTRFMLTEALNRPGLIIGSSMGGWIGLRLLQDCPQKIAGFIGIAAAPDFTKKILDQLNEAQLHDLQAHGYISEPSDYGEPYIFTKTLFTDGGEHCLLHSTIDYHGPIHLLQGKLDTSVDWQMPLAINQCLNGRARITVIPDGDHSLSREQDLQTLKNAIEEMTP